MARCTAALAVGLLAAVATGFTPQTSPSSTARGLGDRRGRHAHAQAHGSRHGHRHGRCGGTTAHGGTSSARTAVLWHGSGATRLWAAGDFGDGGAASASSGTGRSSQYGTGNADELEALYKAAGGGAKGGGEGQTVGTTKAGSDIDALKKAVGSGAGKHGQKMKR